MRSAHIVAASLLAKFTHGSPLQPFDSMVMQTRQAPGSYYPITVATGGVHPRMELRELEKTGEMWNLFLLAMTDFQKMDQNTIDSWFQIAGIHGMPWYVFSGTLELLTLTCFYRADWDGVQASKTDRSLNTGYCTHNNLLFSTWHRPYLVLFEVSSLCS
jgi:tyrosinase